MDDAEKLNALNLIEAEAQRLAKLATSEDLPMVAYLLDVAALEALDEIARSEGARI